MATYNGGQFIREQLDSILVCTTCDDEIIISDDGSTDDTVDIVRTYAKRFANITLVPGPKHGPIANFNHVLSQAHGDIVFLSDQDDIWRADKVSHISSVFAKHECSVVVHNARLVDAFGRATGENLFSLRESRPGLCKNFVRNSYVGCCMAVKADFLSAVLPIPGNVEMHDWWIGLLSDVLAKSVFIDEELIDYRRHSSNVSHMSHHSLPIMISNRMTLAVEIMKRVIREKGYEAS